MTLIYQGHQILEWFKGTYFGVWTYSTYQSQQIGQLTKLLSLVFHLIVQLLTNFNGNFPPILTRAIFKQFSTLGKTQLSPNLQLQFSCNFFNFNINIIFHLWRSLNFLIATMLHVVLWAYLLVGFIRMAQLCRTYLGFSAKYDGEFWLKCLHRQGVLLGLHLPPYHVHSISKFFSMLCETCRGFSKAIFP